jgi:hypothetical protein
VPTTTTPSTAPPPTIVSRLPPTTLPSKPPPVGTGTLTEADVDAWLAAYQRAWETKDAAALVALGVLDAADAASRVGKIAYIKQVRVTKRGQTLSGGTGTVSFDRTDDAGNGPLLKHPPRTCELEKRGGSVVAHGCL